jgi:hypothetical protein
MAKKMITYYSSSNPKKIDVSEYDAYIRDTLFMGSLNYD